MRRQRYDRFHDVVHDGGHTRRLTRHGYYPCAVIVRSWVRRRPSRFISPTRRRTQPSTTMTSARPSHAAAVNRPAIYSPRRTDRPSRLRRPFCRRDARRQDLSPADGRTDTAITSDWATSLTTSSGRRRSGARRRSTPSTDRQRALTDISCRPRPIIVIVDSYIQG